ITVTDLLSIDDTSAIDLAGRGQGFLAGTQYYAGGSYGGRGGFHGNYVSASEYGNYAEPAELGSGGRDGNTGTYRGGGAIKLTVDRLVLDGSIRANGASVTSNSHGGGG